jgi:hypothetical protein
MLTNSYAPGSSAGVHSLVVLDGCLGRLLLVFAAGGRLLALISADRYGRHRFNDRIVDLRVTDDGRPRLLRSFGCMIGRGTRFYGLLLLLDVRQCVITGKNFPVGDNRLLDSGTLERSNGRRRRLNGLDDSLLA